MGKLRSTLLRTCEVGALGALALAAGCRGGPSEAPPVRYQLGMYHQDRGAPQRESDFFADKRYARPPVPGTVPTSAPLDNDRFYRGVNETGAPVTEFPVALTNDLMKRGQSRFDIYCAPCHDRTGSGNGIVVQRAAGAIVRPPSYHDDRLRNMPVGELFNIITNGVRSMPAYSYQVPVEDRWAIVAYIRALQRSQMTTLADVPADKRGDLR
jgi:mono/diheme cytochrome c family protein